MKTTTKLLSILLLIMLIQSCSKDKSSGCGDPTTTYYRNIDSINIPYKTGKSFVYKDKNGTLIATTIKRDTTFFNCILEQVSNPNCGTKNTSCYINKQCFFDSLINIRIDAQYRYHIYFSESSFNILSSALVNHQISYYQYLDSVTFNRTFYKVRLITNNESDSMFINFDNGILKLINRNNTFTIQ